MAAGVVQIPWYATLFRGDAFEAAVKEIAPVALRYGATDYRVYRSRDDLYKFLQMATFEDKAGFEAYWYGPEFNQFRAEYAGWYQVPILYVWSDLVIEGGIDRAPAAIHGAPAEGDTV
jgi:quinol monooxygenase YgiN